MGVLGRGVLDKVPDQLEHIGVAADVMERVIAVGAFRVNEVEHLDRVAFAEQQRDSGRGQLAFGVCDDVARVRLIHVGLDNIP